VNKKAIIIGLILALALGGGVAYRLTHSTTGGGEKAEQKEAGHKDEKGGHDEGKEKKEGHEGHDEHGEEKFPYNFRDFSRWSK